MNKKVKGYKVFNPDWTCRGKQYTCPGKFKEDVELSLCERGMHFCKAAVDCFKYYGFDPKNHVAEVIAYGSVVERGDKCCTNKLEIVREIPWTELLGIVNIGEYCTGVGNSGYGNSGDYNSGDYNSGNCNSGYGNSGDYNSGDCNSGYGNSGDFNSGYGNSGDFNSGDYNSGNCNSGNWNKTWFSNGCFNTIEPKIYLFNKPSDWTYSDWLHSEASCLMGTMPVNTVQWIQFVNMTDSEKIANPKAEATGGYLKEIDDTKNAVAWWQKLSEEQRCIIKAIPNFDAEIFKEITGIDVDKG